MYRASYGGDSPTLYRKALVSDDMLRFDENGTGGPHPAPLMYQSPGTLLKPAKASLGILKCAISGASPLRGARGHGHIGTF